MKIIINENESYEIKFDKEELTADDFFGLLSRLKEIEKVISKAEAIETPSSKVFPKQRKSRLSHISYEWLDDRNKFLEAFKIMYMGTPDQKQKLADKYNTSWNVVYQNIKSLQNNKFKIKPSELNLKYFPNLKGLIRYESRMKKISKAKINGKGDDYE